jgi:hypothetical protein
MTVKHPSASKWAKWPQPPHVDGAPPAFLEHVKAWNKKREPIRIYRPELDDLQTPTLSDCRKLYRVAQIMVDALSCSVFYMLDTTQNKITKLEARIKELEARKIPEYRGVWQEGQQYEKSDLTTYGGSMWIALDNTTARPSTHESSWKLCVKAGRDGKDARR